MRGMGMPQPGEPPPDRVAAVRSDSRRVRIGEGAGSLFLEDLEHAKARGARIYGEVVGYGSAADGWDMIQPIDAGVGSARAMKMALERRGVSADEVDLINPHGTSTPSATSARRRRCGPCSATARARPPVAGDQRARSR